MTKPAEQRDGEGYCGICKFRSLEQQFPPDVRAWVDNLTRLYLWRRAGYSLDREELDFKDWQGLAGVTRCFDAREAQSAAPAAG